MGKSTAALNHLLKVAWENPNHTYWFVSPTYDQAKQQYRRLIGMLWNCREVMTKKNQTELRVKFINGAQIIFKSGDSPDNLRGVSLNGVVVDEVRDQNPDLWALVLRPMLNTTGGWAIFISTPNGFDAFWELYEFARVDTTGEWGHMQASAYECPLYPQKELDSLRNMMTEAEFAQEILAEFRDMTAGRAYYNYGTHNERMDSPFAKPGEEYSEHLPILLGMDFNLNPMAWTLGQHLNREFHWTDEIHLAGSNTPEAAKVLIEKLFSSGVCMEKVGVILCGDASGKATQRTSNKSDFDIVKEHLFLAGIKYSDRTPDSNPSIKDRVNTVNAALKSGTGKVSMTLNPVKCVNLRKDFQRVVWKNSSDKAILDEGSKHERTHNTDGVGYPICVFAPIKVSGRGGKMRVIVR